MSHRTTAKLEREFALLNRRRDCWGEWWPRSYLWFDLPLKTPDFNSVKGALVLVNKLAEFSDWQGNDCRRDCWAPTLLRRVMTTKLAMILIFLWRLQISILLRELSVLLVSWRSFLIDRATKNCVKPFHSLKMSWWVHNSTHWNNHRSTELLY